MEEARLPMQKHMKVWLTLIILYAFLLPFAAGSVAQPKEILKFEEQDTLKDIREKIEHNGYNFKVDHNWVTEMSPEMKKSFFRRHLPLFPKGADVSEGIGPLARHLGRALPSQFDWRDYNGHSYIGPIRDQGYCGSCYAFGACAAAEGSYNWAMGNYDGNCADFSEAYLAFCLSDYYSGFDGCSGANYDYEELDALVDYGVCDEYVYTYVDYEQPCGVSEPLQIETTKFNSWHRIDCNDIDSIKTAIMTYGVVVAAVYAGTAFQGYDEGLYEDSNTTCPGYPPFYPECYYTETNHAVALTGWDDNPPEGGGGCWILRNSWGSAWGEDGYMRLTYQSARVSCAVSYLVFSISPTVSTGQATSVTSKAATLNGTVNPNGEDTTYYFEYGETTSYGSTTMSTGAGSGVDEISVSADITGLNAYTAYHFRIVAINSGGTSYGSDQSFVTRSQMQDDKKSLPWLPLLLD